MAVYRCNHCGMVGERITANPGSKAPCGKCSQPISYFATTDFIQKLVEKYLATRRELNALKDVIDEREAETSSESTEIAATLNVDNLAIELQNTRALATALQHEPLLKWFSTRQIGAQFDYHQVDTTGFFDEAAKAIGDHYELLSGPIEQVCWAYRRDFTWINIDLGKREAQEANVINDAFRTFYGQSLFARYSYQKQKEQIGLTIQPAPAVRRFFDGGWLEWYVFIEIVNRCLETNRAFSCARGAKVEFQDETLRELDVAFLIDGRLPLFVECKTGEFRAEIDKYAKFKRRLGVDKAQFVMCCPELSNELAAGLTAMYELTFVNLSTLQGHVISLFHANAPRQ